MLSKMKSKSSIFSSSSFDRNKFVNDVVEKSYNDIVVHKNCILERNFDDLELYMGNRLRIKIRSCLQDNHAEVNTSGAIILREC